MEPLYFNIHGDNIVECERTFFLILNSFNDGNVKIEGPYQSAVCPTFRLQISEPRVTLIFTFFPGFGRWPQNILTLVRDRGGPLREAADAIITQVLPASEEPLLAIEYCGALPAGNQAWQRNGRAYSFARAKIPYIYIAELGGYELDSERSRKAARLPNPAVPFSYLIISASLDTPVLPVFVPGAGASSGFIRDYNGVFGDQDLLRLIRNLILKESHKEATEPLKLKALELVRLLASGRRRSDTLTPQQWTEAYEAISRGGSLVQYLLRIPPFPWEKTAYIKSLTTTARRLMKLSAQHAIGLTSSVLPLCVVPANRRRSFLRGLKTLYTTLPQIFIEWLSKPSDLMICWVMGFKPRGDDARPDRGLPPLARMLIGEDADLLTVVYGPAPKTTWPLLKNDPVTLMRNNGLWEAILTVSNAMLIDSSTASALKTKAFLSAHWAAGIPHVQASSVLVKPNPLQTGEHDIDTVLHLLFSRIGAPQVFEGMCNPPGGDWSGISLLIPDRSLELRWLSLPRVTSRGAKRPDHVFEIFGIHRLPIVLAIESKERPSLVEKKIGQRLIKYVNDLISTLPSVQRANPHDPWKHATATLPPDSVQFASAAAFIISSETELQTIAPHAAADLVLGFEFNNGGGFCTIHVRACTGLGNTLSAFIRSLPSANANITIRESQ